MAAGSISFSDGRSYEHSMGVWSRLVGKEFLDWLAVPEGLTWIDVGCGNGCFTEAIFEECNPAGVLAIDPSEAQIDFALKRLKNKSIDIRTGSALDLPYSDDTCDVAIMALVLFFVSDPRRSVDEMRRVVRKGGVVASYAWDTLGGGFPHEPVQRELAAIGVRFPLPPSVEISPIEPTRRLWQDSGLENVQCRVIEVERTFDDFDDMWNSFMTASIGRVIESLDQSTREAVRQKVRARLPENDDGGITYKSWANCVKGRVPDA